MFINNHAYLSCLSYKNFIILQEFSEKSNNI